VTRLAGIPCSAWGFPFYGYATAGVFNSINGELMARFGGFLPFSRSIEVCTITNGVLVYDKWRSDKVGFSGRWKN